MANPVIYAEQVPGGTHTCNGSVEQVADDARAVKSLTLQVPGTEAAVDWGYITRDGVFVKHGAIAAGSYVNIQSSPLTPSSIYVKGTSGKIFYWTSVGA